MIVLWARWEHRETEYASGYASTRQITVEISAIPKEYRNTSL